MSYGEQESSDIWKDGEVKLFLKSPTKPADEVKSYRPITQLPVLGQIFERMIVGRICKHASETGEMSAGQLGFRTALGTGTALRKLAGICDDTYEKWLIVVFADVAGAFDHAWWPVIALIEQI